MASRALARRAARCGSRSCRASASGYGWPSGPSRSPGPGEVRVRVEACGVCGSDHFLQAGGFGPAVPFPIVPGHEAAGRVDALGDGVEGVAVGDQVALYYITTPPGDRVGGRGPTEHQPAHPPDGRRPRRRVRRVRRPSGRGPHPAAAADPARSARGPDRRGRDPAARPPAHRPPRRRGAARRHRHRRPGLERGPARQGDGRDGHRGHALGGAPGAGAAARSATRSSRPTTSGRSRPSAR